MLPFSSFELQDSNVSTPTLKVGGKLKPSLGAWVSHYSQLYPVSTGFDLFF